MDAERCLAFAREAEELARDTADPDLAELCVVIARSWREMALEPRADPAPQLQ